MQAVTATAIYAGSHKNASATDIAANFIAEAGAAFVGKVAHTGIEPVIQHLGGAENVQRIGAIVAGKVSGIATNTGLAKSGAAAAVAAGFATQAGKLKAYIKKEMANSRLGFAADPGAGDVSGLDQQIAGALFDLLTASYIATAATPEKGGS